MLSSLKMSYHLTLRLNLNLGFQMDATLNLSMMQQSESHNQVPVKSQNEVTLKLSEGGSTQISV